MVDLCKRRSQRQRIVEGLFGKRVVAIELERTTEGVLDQRVARLDLCGLTGILQGEFAIVEIARDHRETGECLRIVAGAQSGTEMLFGQSLLTLGQGDMPQGGVRAALVWIQRQRPGQHVASLIEFTAVEIHLAQRQQRCG